jgi:serine/threonine protein kinase
VPLKDFDHRQLAKCLSTDEEKSVRADIFMRMLLETHEDQLVPYVKYPHAGKDLSALCAQRAVSETDLVQAFAGLFCDLAQMKDLGILHLDIKPLNMTGRQQEDGLKLMLIDFGFGGLAGSPNVLKSAEYRLKQPMPQYRYLAPEFYLLHIVYFSTSRAWPPPGHRRSEKVESFEDAVAVLHRTGRIAEKIRPRDIYVPVSELLGRFRARSRKEQVALDWLYKGMQAMVTEYFVRVVEMLARAEDMDAVQELLRQEVQVLVESWDTYSAAVSCLQTLHDVRPKEGSDLFESVVRLLGASVLTVPATARASVENMDLCEQLQEFSLA